MSRICLFWNPATHTFGVTEPWLKVYAKCALSAGSKLVSTCWARAQKVSLPTEVIREFSQLEPGTALENRSPPSVSLLSPVLMGYLPPHSGDLFQAWPSPDPM